MNSKLKRNISSGKFMEDKDKSVTESKGKAKSYNQVKNKNKKDNMVGNDKSTSAIEEREDIVIGRNAVIEALRGERTIEALYISNSKLEGSIKTIVGLAKENKILIKEVDKRKLDSMCGGEVHQGVIAKVTPYKYSEVSDILDLAEKRGEAPFIVILDEVEDPHNLGSIVRTAELFGVHGIILPKRRSASVSTTVYKSSVGAIEHVKIAKVTNLNSTIEELKEKGIWIYGADIRAEEYSYQVDFGGPCAVIIGNEGRGISKLTVEKCDKLIKIPMVGKINSLNASVAGGIIMYEVLKGRLK
ncbi:23S rRNA (guanosine2251-2'-O)-methyltransferase [Clostridium beijerinckii]|jgi:rRNA methylase, putative, group 3|uniref:23S rRNA (Guanosine(2251)-2'-O)-methyltransferase RlmB n=3 Tax=Clostridium beijerinckii TaxID=1520 RepID=A0A1S8RJD7_CLOBE|nr:23S rRNA (guanosine(2251)-2'-O)-methyltransferase RlmB [Clostridium beijerinckii]ABR32323.1 RNA methyltransferase, TrmH family, group 3 [Clostridium beijerinckii NCIMB 8052]AIU04630.1 RNA methyltransferase [Clostridium beijerinckii ATCC 35702]MBF7807999.1 23S rRNA (guanosine(2251)-2'-O)-methyltransferase RlmB [Clostridium beijerinckii]NOW88598.1 23S rRNA (guanosine2251-2'-O)-methyltransferase [Clostridium beijerinckii]NRT21562.1 23S rRNA (guanosine2251-2'-O)-methyltransferase [Clostridium b